MCTYEKKMPIAGATWLKLNVNFIVNVWRVVSVNKKDCQICKCEAIAYKREETDGCVGCLNKSVKRQLDGWLVLVVDGRDVGSRKRLHEREMADVVEEVFTGVSLTHYTLLGVFV